MTEPKRTTDNVSKRNATSVAALNLYTCEAKLAASEGMEHHNYYQRRYEDAKARMRELLND